MSCYVLISKYEYYVIVDFMDFVWTIFLNIFAIME